MEQILVLKNEQNKTVSVLFALKVKVQLNQFLSAQLRSVGWSEALLISKWSFYKLTIIDNVFMFLLLSIFGFQLFWYCVIQKKK